MLQFYRELGWRMVKIVRNAYGMAIPGKIRGSFSRTIYEKNEKVLGWGREKRWSGGEYTVDQVVLRQIVWCATHHAKPGLKNILKDSASQKKTVFFF